MLKYQISSKSVQREPNFSGRTDGQTDRQTDRQTDITKLSVAFLNFINASTVYSKGEKTSHYPYVPHPRDIFPPETDPASCRTSLLFLELHWIVVIDAFRVTIIIIYELLSWEQNPRISLCTLQILASLSTAAATNSSSSLSASFLVGTGETGSHS